MIEVNEKMCYSTLMVILVKAKEVNSCIHRIEFTSPDMEGEGFSGYMETSVKFLVNDLTLFAKLRKEAYDFCFSKDGWYEIIKNGKLNV